jgi:hypothetical protein
MLGRRVVIDRFPGSVNALFHEGLGYDWWRKESASGQGMEGEYATRRRTFREEERKRGPGRWTTLKGQGSSA